MKYLLLALLLVGCTEQFNFENGDCFAQPSREGAKFFKVLDKKNNSYLIQFLNTKEFTAIPPIQGWELSQKIDCEIAEKALTKNKEVVK